MGTSGFEIVALNSGVSSIRDLATGEICHPGIGPVEEARILHIEQQKLFARAINPGKLVIWDVGLGGAANAICALEALGESNAEVEIHSFDRLKDITLFALEKASELGYVEAWKKELGELLDVGQVNASEKVRWIYHLGDFRETMLAAPKADIVFYDPYSSASNQELWTLDHLTRMRVLLNGGCTLTNYSASSAVKVTWLLAGFYVGSGTPIGKKTETLYASTSPYTVPNPLGKEWLEKMTRSQNSAPIRELILNPRPIQREDYAALSEHPQFN